MSAGALRSAPDFIAAGLVASDTAAAIAPVFARYSAAMSADLAALVDRSDPHDPIARQFVPDARELDPHPGELHDPIGDNVHSPVPGLVHRYVDRALLKVVAACPVYCRFCFRRESVGEGKGGPLPDADLAAAVDFIAAHREITEVILTGGDPLALSARRLRAVLARLAAIAHVRTLRFHTRVPVVEPGRVTGELVAALRGAGKPVFVAVHANHAREFSPAARAACAMLVDAGVPLLGQSVLLAGVNDCADTLVALMRAFIEARITPYYLHHPDLAPGTGHFRVPIARGRALMAQIAARLPGFARPRYMLDLPGGFGKVDLMSDAVSASGPNLWMIRDRAGRHHSYADCLPGAVPGVAKWPD